MLMNDEQTNALRFCKTKEKYLFLLEKKNVFFCFWRVNVYEEEIS